MEHPPPTPLRIAVVVGDDVRADASRLQPVVERANVQLGWRYDCQFVLGDGGPPRPDPITGGHEPSWQNPPDWRDADIVVVVVWNTRPRALMAVGPMEVALWGPTDPDLLVMTRKGAALVETPQEAYEKAATLEFCQAAGDRLYPYDDALSFEMGLFNGMARIARDRWTRREGTDRLFCPVCGAESPIGTAPAVCVEHNKVLLLQRHRKDGLGHDNLLGIALDGGRYPLHGRIGGGSFGAVYFARMQPEGHPVAVKVLRRLGRQLEVKRFEREVRLLEQIAHPNVVRIIDHGWEREGPMYAVMEYLPGRSLSDVLHRLDARTLCELMLHVLDGLSAVHMQGMVHRDLKPANIMLVDDPTRPDQPPRPVLIDLGLGKQQLHEGSELTQHGMAMGTHNYMAPEQFERAHAVDDKADLYSIAVIIYRGLTGAPPFDFRGLDPVQQVEAWTEKWRELSTLAPPPIERDDIPPELVEAVMTGLAKRPEDRFESALAMREALFRALKAWRNRLHDHTPLPLPSADTMPRPVPRPVDPEPAQPVPLRARRKNDTYWWPLAGAAAVLFVGLIALLWVRRGRQDDPPPNPGKTEISGSVRPSTVAPVTRIKAMPDSAVAVVSTTPVFDDPELPPPYPVAERLRAVHSRITGWSRQMVREGVALMPPPAPEPIAFDPVEIPEPVVAPPVAPESVAVAAVEPPPKRPRRAVPTEASPARAAKPPKAPKSAPVIAKKAPPKATPPARPPVAKKTPESAPAPRPPRTGPYADAVNQAKTALRTGNLAAGVRAWEKAAALKPGLRQPHQVLCRIAPRVGKKAIALRHCKRWKALESSAARKAAADRAITQLGG